MSRLGLWRSARIIVGGRPDWVFIKLHCHGMHPGDEQAMYGAPMRNFLTELTDYAKSSGSTLHFTTAREMVNIILAACDGRDGSPSNYRDYRLISNSPCAGTPTRTPHEIGLQR